VPGTLHEVKEKSGTPRKINFGNTQPTFLLKMADFWDTAPSSLFEVDRRFRSMYCLHHQGDGKAARPDDGGSMHL
jgi:hypothetical protein